MAKISFSKPDFNSDDHLFHIVLVAPEIPQNSGNIVRLCTATRGWLHLVKPLGYKLEDRYLKRAGLDYWPGVTISLHENLASLEAMLPQNRTWLFTKRAKNSFWKPKFPKGSVLIFGRETKGLPADFVKRWQNQTLRIPTSSNVRSLNLANSVSIASYEVLRQHKWLGEAPMKG